MKKETKNDLKRVISATKYSIAGICAAWQNEAAFRLEVFVSVILIPAAFFVGQSGTERAVLIFSCFFVLITELLNSAIEAIVDRVGTEHHVLSGRAKDIGSAAVFLSILNLLVIWGIFLSPIF